MEKFEQKKDGIFSLQEQVSQLSGQLTQKEERIKELEKLAMIDPLTNVFNRRGFELEIEKYFKSLSDAELHSERRESEQIKEIGIAFFDVDFFKKINDAYGHEAGDEALKAVASSISDCLRGLDLVGRWGGEEFIVALPNATEDEAYKVADRIRKKVSQLNVEWGNKKINFTISGGVAGYSADNDFKSILRKADLALYEAKNRGRNQVVGAKDLEKELVGSTA